MSLLIQAKTKTLKSDIKKELRIYFPAIDFKIVSCQEEGRTAFTISYTDGVSKTRVRNVVRQFAHTYYADRTPVKVDFEIERNMSGKTENLLLNEMKSVWNIKGGLSMEEHFKSVGGTVRDYIVKIFNMRDF